MPPPPPPLGRSRRRTDHSFDPALDDAELVAVRAQLSQGRWSRARSLIAATGNDWDRRGHRLVVLAQAAGAAAWAGDWVLAEPESADAVTLVACAAVLGALRGKEPEALAREAVPPRRRARARRPDSLAGPAAPGPFPRHGGRSHPALRPGAAAPPRAPPRPPPDGGPPRRTQAGHRKRPAPRGVRLRSLGRRTGPGRLPARRTPRGRPRRALPQPSPSRAASRRTPGRPATGRAAAPAR